MRAVPADWTAFARSTLHDAVHRPAQALHQALSELPRGGTFGDVGLAAVAEKTPGCRTASAAVADGQQ